MTGSGGKVGEGFKVRTEFYRVFIYFNAINCCRWRVSPVAECGTPRASASGRPTPGGALTCRPVLSFFFFFAEEAQKQKQKKGKSFPSFSFFLFNGPATAGDRSVHGRASHWPDALARPRRSSFVSVAVVVVVVVVVGVCVCVCVGLARSTVTSSWRERITSSAVRFWIFFKEKQTNSWTAASVCA